MLCFPNCKINLGLYVTHKRPDGYHDLETVFYPVPLRDVLEIVPAETETTITLSGKTVEGDSSNNLVWKAYQLMKAHFSEQIPALSIYLHKLIPMGAGLGGGSSDGAFMLQLINDECNLHLPPATLAEMALQLGSDCPFFIYNTPQFASGRGEQFESIAVDLSGFTIQLICPKVHISTADAFRMLTPGPAAFDLRQLAGLPVGEWKERISNDFEEPVFHAHPELGEIKEELYAQGAIYASMSGSGSAIYGLFEKGKKAILSSKSEFETYTL
jgi:4-diphosphocytidyl-2-C-methyl-D-erythritol kinase